MLIHRACLAAGLLLLSGSLFAADVITPTSSAPSAAPAPSSPATPADYSSPKNAAKSFLNAVRAADMAAMKDAVVTPADQQEAVQTFLSILVSGSDLQKAATARFGSEGTKAFGSTSTPALEARLKSVDAAEVRITGDTATLSLPADPANQQAAGTILVKKTGADWKLDGPALFGLSSATAAQNASRLQLAKSLMTINDQVSRDIKAGKYLSAADAYQDYWNRSRVVSTAPASRPE